MKKFILLAFILTLITPVKIYGQEITNKIELTEFGPVSSGIKGGNASLGDIISFRLDENTIISIVRNTTSTASVPGSLGGMQTSTTYGGNTFFSISKILRGQKEKSKNKELSVPDKKGLDKEIIMFTVTSKNIYCIARYKSSEKKGAYTYYAFSVDFDKLELTDTDQSFYQSSYDYSNKENRISSFIEVNTSDESDIEETFILKETICINEKVTDYVFSTLNDKLEIQSTVKNHLKDYNGHIIEEKLFIKDKNHFVFVTNTIPVDVKTYSSHSKKTNNVLDIYKIEDGKITSYSFDTYEKGYSFPAVKWIDNEIFISGIYTNNEPAPSGMKHPQLYEPKIEGIYSCAINNKTSPSLLNEIKSVSIKDQLLSHVEEIDWNLYFTLNIYEQNENRLIIIENLLGRTPLDTRMKHKNFVISLDRNGKFNWLAAMPKTNLDITSYKNYPLVRREPRFDYINYHQAYLAINNKNSLTLLYCDPVSSNLYSIDEKGNIKQESFPPIKQKYLSPSAIYINGLPSIIIMNTDIEVIISKAFYYDLKIR